MQTYDLRRISSKDKREILAREGFDVAKVIRKARPIVNAVRHEGDEALRRFAEKFDRFGDGLLTLPKEGIRAATKRIDPGLLRSLRASYGRVKAFHSRQQTAPFSFSDSCGKFGQKVVALRRVGVYVPGGTASYASSVIMACVPARVAGVDEIAVCTPGRNGIVQNAILAACAVCGVDEVHPVGGAHAVAAMAYGTESIRNVQKIVGPGGAMVSAAKLLVRNDCEIDFLAGPSEILVVAGPKADPELIALEMLAQLEHDVYARAVLVTTSTRVAKQTRQSLESLLRRTPRREIAVKAAERGASFVVASNLSEALDFADEYAPEHLLIDVDNPEKALARVRNAGSVFLGPNSSVVFGDYIAGTNHILPTKGSATARSSLSVFDFVKVIPYQKISAKGAASLAKDAEKLARSEGLHAHADAALARAGGKGR